MALFHPPPGAHVLAKSELDCVCGQPMTHVLLRPVAIEGQRETDLSVFARGYCNACSPVLVKGSEAPPAPWWLKALNWILARPMFRSKREAEG